MQENDKRSRGKDIPNAGRYEKIVLYKLVSVQKEIRNKLFIKRYHTNK